MLVNVVVAVLMKHLEESNKEAQLEEMEEKREREEQREREEASRRLSTASMGGDLGPNGDTPAQVRACVRISACVEECRGYDDDDSGDDLIWQVQVEDEECSHGNLMSMGRMLSLPSDSYAQPLRCSPYPPIGHEACSSYSYSGALVVYSQLN